MLFKDFIFGSHIRVCVYRCGRLMFFALNSAKIDVSPFEPSWERPTLSPF